MTPYRTVLAAASVLLVAGFPERAPADEVPEFHAFLRPEIGFAVPGEAVEVRFEVDSTAKQFNGYEITIQFDPEVVSFESVDEGDLMIDACPDRFTDLTSTDSTVTFAHVLLCAGVSVNGPGLLSLFHFRADAFGMSSLEILTDPDRTFVDGGLFVWPQHPTYPRQVVLHDASVVVIDPTTDAADIGGRLATPLRVTVLPNPIRDAGSILIRTGDGTSRAGIDLLDISGRRLRVWRLGPEDGGEIRIPWRAVDRNGLPLPAGAYFIRIEAEGRCAGGRIFVVR